MNNSRAEARRPSVTMCGSLAQLVEQRPEEPCVPSSSLGGATKLYEDIVLKGDFLFVLTKVLYFSKV